MNQCYMSFNDAVSGATINPMERSRLIAIAVAVAVAQSLPLPTSPVENPALHFVTTVNPAGRNTLNDLNESLVFDCKAAAEYVRAFWMLRYTAAHACIATMIGSDYCFFSKIFGCDLYISKDDYAYMNANKNTLEVLVAAACQLMKAIDEANKSAVAL